jgi:hypothetical protein
MQNILKSGRKRLLGRARCEWEVYIKMDVTELEWDDAGWIHLAQDRISDLLFRTR